VCFADAWRVAVRKLIELIGRGLKHGLVAIGALAFIGSVIALADYTATQGSGITFASVVISAKHYTAQVLCDFVAGESQCAQVDSSGRLATFTQVSSSVLPNGAATSTNQTSEITALTSINTAVNASVPAGINVIGGVTFPTNITATDCSSTVATGNTAQNAFTAQTTLHGFTLANIDASAGSGEPLWISFTGTASTATGSYPLAAPTATTFAGLSSFTAPTGFGLNHALSVVAATSGHKYSCTWW
jgi:hypothetical protein